MAQGDTLGVVMQSDIGSTASGGVAHQAVEPSLAPTFSTSGTYAVGDFVTKDGVLYVCTTAHNTAAWDASHFTAVNAGTYLNMVYAANAVANGGVAPGGFGLGDSINDTWVSTPDDIPVNVTGWFLAYLPTIIATSYGGWHYIMQIYEGRSLGLTKQIAYGVDTSANQNTSRSILTRQKVGSKAWTDWEFINPPLIAGEEYRTTERFLGKPVYVKVLTSKTSRAGETIYWDGDDTLTNLSDFVGVSGALGRGPLVNGPGVTEIGVDMSLNQLYLVRAAGASTYNARPIVKYTKNN